MKRSQVNALLRTAEEFSQARNFCLPPFAYWSLSDWGKCQSDLSEIIANRLGWDITDFGQGDFDHVGLTLFTIRNGSLADLRAGQGRVYAEKLLIVEVDQVTPMHFHWIKTEDIINRGGGNLVVQVYNATPDDGLDSGEVTVHIDSIPRRFQAGGKVSLQPGESITLTPRLYHAFWGEGERVLVGEVSSVNNDATDNRFFRPVGRFPTIEEDEPPYRLLVNDYQHFLKTAC